MAKYRYNISVYSWSYITNKGTTARHNRIQTALSSKFFAISWICMFKTKVSSWVNPPLAPPRCIFLYFNKPCRGQLHYQQPTSLKVYHEIKSARSYRF